MDDLDFSDLELGDLPNMDDLPSIDELLANSESNRWPLVISPPLTANRTLYSQKISIRIPHYLLDTLKAQAAARGMPYQTFINLILGAYANGYWRL